jgi:cysteine dioxygenase
MGVSLKELLDRLDGYSSRIPLDDLAAMLRGFEPEWDALRPFQRFHPQRYLRNLLRGSDVYHALLLCWRAGQRSPIHDHRGSNCAFRVLAGTATESTFQRTEQGLIYPTGSCAWHAGDVCASRDADIHQVSNLDSGGDLLTLHLYSPPLLVMGQYSLQTMEASEFLDPVFEFSLGGGI